MTGEVQWRNRPPSVAIRGADSVIETLLRLGLERFIRRKEEINKEAILNEPSAVSGVAGITVKRASKILPLFPLSKMPGCN